MRRVGVTSRFTPPGSSRLSQSPQSGRTPQSAGQCFPTRTCSSPLGRAQPSSLRLTVLCHVTRRIHAPYSQGEAMGKPPSTKSSR